MTLEEEYYARYDAYAVTYVEYVRAVMLGRSEEDVAMLVSAYERASEDFRALREESMGLSDLPDIEVYIRDDGSFNWFPLSRDRGLLSIEGLIPESRKRDVEDRCRIGELIRKYILLNPIKKESDSEEQEPEQEPETNAIPEPEPQPEPEQTDDAKSGNWWSRFVGGLFNKKGEK